MTTSRVLGAGEAHGLDEDGGQTCEAGAEMEAGVMHWLVLRVFVARDHKIAVTERVCYLRSQSARCGRQ